MVEMQHNKLHNLVVTTLGAEMPKKNKKRNIEQEIVLKLTKDLADLIQQRNVFKEHCELLPNRANEILVSTEHSDLYESRQDIEELYMHFGIMEQEFKVALSELESEIMNIENQLVNAVGRFKNDERELLQKVRESYVHNEEAPF